MDACGSMLPLYHGPENLQAKTVMSELGVRGQVRALEPRDMSRGGKAATRRRYPNQDATA